MHDELEKVDKYFVEGQRLWSVQPDQVQSRSFYLLWEEQWQPLPFPIVSRELAIAGQTVLLADDEQQLGCFGWDSDEECMAMMVEGATTRQKFLLMFHDSGIDVVDTPVQMLDDHDLSFGERLEVMYDVIAHLRLEHPTTDLRQLSLSTYRETLGHLTGQYDSRTIRVMKKLTRATVAKLVGKVMEDMAVDEISDQLVLPLDGSYASSAALQSPALTVPGTQRIRLPCRTAWTTLRELDFVREALDHLATLQLQCVITFENCVILAENSPRQSVIRVPVEADFQLREGERLSVFLRGESAPVAKLRIELVEENAAVGTFMWNEVPVDDSISDKLYARPRPGPNNFLARMTDAVVAELKTSNEFSSPILNGIFGLKEVVLAEHEVTCSFASLDETQNCAVQNAINDENMIVAIQGPPGTGKTHTLEVVLRQLCDAKQRVLVTAPSNAAVDNVCRRVRDLPVLRLGRERESIAPDIVAACWIQSRDAVDAFKTKRAASGSIYAGTHLGVLRDELVNADHEQNGIYDVIVFDEAGMANLTEFMLCARLARRVILFGDHQQLPPFPLPADVIDHLHQYRTANRAMWDMIRMSALEWLVERRHVPVCLLQASYRCQNPRLMRFSSTLFYNARVRASEQAEYYQLSFVERLKRFPPSTLRLFRTSRLPLAVRGERLVVTGKRPGLENPFEATIAIRLFYQFVQRYPLEEITIIAPYRRQVRLIRDGISLPIVRELSGDDSLDETRWSGFLFSRIATVDSFQGGESDVVIITYVRSNENSGIGFVDDANRVNVAHTRCRREMVVIADTECLKRQSHGTICARMERAIERDGEIIDVPEDEQQFAILLANENGSAEAGV